MSRVLVVGDTHEPYSRPKYLDFCRGLRDKYKCDAIIHIGDLVDWHSISFHPKSPEMPGPTIEYEQAHTRVQKWYEAFPKMKIVLGNHDSRIIRLAESVNIPSKLVQSFNDTWDTNGWTWDWDYVIDDVCYVHGINCGGIHPAYNRMCKTGMSHVLGHIHSAAGVKWLVNPQRRMFGMDVGCGVNDRSLAFAYGRFTTIRSVISAAVVLDGIPYHEVMPIGKNEKFWDKKNRK